MEEIIKMLIGLAIIIGADFIIIGYASRKWSTAIRQELEYLLDKYISPRDETPKENKERRRQEWEAWKAEHDKDSVT